MPQPQHTTPMFPTLTRVTPAKSAQTFVPPLAPPTTPLPAEAPTRDSQLATATARIRALHRSGIKFATLSRKLGGSPSKRILERLARARTTADYDIPKLIDGRLTPFTCIGETECRALNDALLAFWPGSEPEAQPAPVVAMEPTPEPVAAPKRRSPAPHRKGLARQVPDYDAQVEGLLSWLRDASEPLRQGGQGQALARQIAETTGLGFATVRNTLLNRGRGPHAAYPVLAKIAAAVVALRKEARQ